MITGGLVLQVQWLVKSRSLAEFNEEKMQMRKLTKLHDNSMKKLCYKRKKEMQVYFKRSKFFFLQMEELVGQCSMSMSIINGK